MYLPFDSCAGVADALARQPVYPADTLWLLCVADTHGEQVPALLDTCRARGIRVAGGVFPGLVHGEDALHEGLIALPLPAESKVLVAELHAEGARWQHPLPQTEDAGYQSAILFMDCLAKGISTLMAELYDHFGGRISYFGAGTGYRDLKDQPSVFDGERFLRGVGLLVLSPRRATVRVRHGWKRVAGPFVASRTNGNIISELNWEPAEGLYRQAVAAQAPALADRPIFPDVNAVYPLCIAYEGGEDIIRDPIQVDPEGAITVLSDVAENAMMYLAYGDQESLIAAAREAVLACGTPTDPGLCFVSDCYSRALKLGDDFSLELQAVGEALRGICDRPVEGVLGLGEVANSDGRYLALHNKTFVIALAHD
jgi:hypothetical protein